MNKFTWGAIGAFGFAACAVWSNQSAPQEALDASVVQQAASAVPSESTPVSASSTEEPPMVELKFTDIPAEPVPGRAQKLEQEFKDDSFSGKEAAVQDEIRDAFSSTGRFAVQSLECKASLCRLTGTSPSLRELSRACELVSSSKGLPYGMALVRHDIHADSTVTGLIFIGVGDNPNAP